MPIIEFQGYTMFSGNLESFWSFQVNILGWLSGKLLGCFEQLNLSQREGKSFAASRTKLWQKRSDKSGFIGGT